MSEETCDVNMFDNDGITFKPPDCPWCGKNVKDMKYGNR